MKKIYFAGQDNFGNRGCEALIRANVKLIQEQLPNSKFLVPSSDIQKDAAQWPTAASLGVDFINSEPIPSKIRWWSRAKRFWKGLEAIRPNFKLSPKTAAAIDECDALIMTGGDIISLDYGLESLYYWAGICEAGMKAGKPTVLWAASIGPFNANPKVESLMVEYLSRFSLITVRETATLAYLKKIGVKGAHYVADPAFCLDAEAAPADELAFFDQKQIPVLGFNVSPLIRKFRESEDSKKSLDLDIVKFLVQVLKTTDFKILLIPHVDPLNDAEENSDSSYMSKLLNQLHTMHPELNDRIKLLRRGLNSAQLKDVIRHCKCFMGARTHSTVAALSQGIPTTSIAYSIKAKGINHDLFGHTNYVLNTPEVTTTTLMSHFNMLCNEHQNIVSTLKRRTPELQIAARKSVELFAQII
jgi:polysaccharide pyruvyl transferase WcaK-like protein